MGWARFLLLFCLLERLSSVDGVDGTLTAWSWDCFLLLQQQQISTIIRISKTPPTMAGTTIATGNPLLTELEFEVDEDLVDNAVDDESVPKSEL